MKQTDRAPIDSRRDEAPAKQFPEVLTIGISLIIFVLITGFVIQQLGPGHGTTASQVLIVALGVLSVIVLASGIFAGLFVKKDKAH